MMKKATNEIIFPLLDTVENFLRRALSGGYLLPKAKRLVVRLVAVFRRAAARVHADQRMHLHKQCERRRRVLLAPVAIAALLLRVFVEWFVGARPGIRIGFIEHDVG